MKANHLNYIILCDGVKYYLFERENKEVPFSAYSKSKCLKIGNSVDEILGKSETDFPENSEIDLPKNSESLNPISLGSLPKIFEIEKTPYEVVFNE